MAAVGYASLPISVDLRGIQKNIRSQVQAPMEAATKKAGRGIAQGFKTGVDAAGAEVKRLEALEKKAAETVVSQQKKVSDAKADVVAKMKQVEAAEKSLEAARAGGDAKVRAAEEALAKLRASGKASVEELEQAELKLKQVRASAEASVASKEAAVERARLGASKATDKLADSEKKLGDNQKFAAGVSADLLSATKRLDAEQDKLTKSVTEQDNAWGRLSRAIRSWGRDAGRAAGDVDGISRKFGGLKVRMAREGDEAGKAFGRAMSDGLEKSTHSLRNSVSFGAVAGGVAALTSSAIGSIKGLAREALSASDATDKFKSTLTFAGLDTGKIDELTKSARDYADKTVYELADIQNVTAQLAANGVNNYDKLAEAGGNLNAIAGGNAETFKSVGLVLSQVNGAGKLVTQDWNQIANAIPGASGKIQEALLQAGAYTGNFRDAMSKGEITAEEFNDAILKIGSEPVAVEAAKSTATFEGMIGNLEANIRGGLADALNELKPEIGAVFKGISDFAAVAMPKLVDGIQSGAKTLKKFNDFLQDNQTWIKPLSVSVGILAGAFAGLALQHKIMLAGGVIKWFKTLTWVTKLQTAAQFALNVVTGANPWVKLAVVIATVAGGLYTFFTKTETGQRLWKKFVDGIKAGWEAIKEGFTAGVDWIQDKWKSFTDGIQKVKDGFNGLKDLFLKGDFSGGLRDAFGVEEDSPIVEKFLTIRDAFVNAFNGIKEFASLWWEQVKASFQSGVDTVKTVFETGWNVIKDIFATAWLVIVDFFTGNWSRIPETIAAGWAAIKGHFSDGVEKVKQVISDWSEGTRERVGRMWDALKEAFSAAFEAIKGKAIEWAVRVGATFADLKAQASEKVRSLVESVKQKFVEMKDNVITTVKELPDRIKGFFAKSGEWLVDAGRNIMTGLLDGLKRKFEEIKSWLGDVKNHITGTFSGATSSAERQIRVHHRHAGGEIPRFAAGGVLPDIPGISRSVRDPIVGVTRRGVPIARVEPGEFIVNREATRKHLPLLAAINGGRLNGKQGDLGLPRYADGGLVTADELLRFFKGERVNGQQASRSLEGATYTYAGSNWGDCSSTQGQGALFAVGKPATNGRYMATMDAEQKLSAIGFKPGLGSGPRYAIGWFNGGPWNGHTSGTIDFGNGKTINIEMGGGRGNGQIGGGAAPASHSQYTDHKHLPLAGASAVKPEAIKSTSVDGVTYRDSNGTTRTDPQFGAAQSLWEASKRSLGLYDNGGWLPHGGVAVNLSGRPERVLAAPELAGLNKIGDALGKLVKPWEQVAATTLKDSAINLGGGFLGRTKLVADAEKGLAEVRAQVAADLEVIGKAEADLAKAREAGDPEQIKQAEAALAKAREHGDTAAKRIEAAERTVAAARIQAAGEIAQKVFEGLSQAFQQVAGFLGQVAQFAEAAEKTREEISKLHQQQVMLRIEGIKSTNDLRVAEWDVAKVRMKGLIAVAKAEDELAKARKGHLQLGRSGVDGLSRAVDRFRITGAQSMEALGATFVANAAEVEAAEWGLQAVRAQANLDNLDAEYAANAARIKVAEATMAQAQAAEMLQLQVLKLQDQTKRLYGMTSSQAQGAQGFVGGIGGIFGGIAKLIGGLFAGGAALATGNLLGAVTAGAGALGGIQSIVGGIGQVRANKDDFKQAWSSATPGAKLGMGLGVAGGVLGGAVGVGGTLATGNAEWANAGTQLGNAFTGATMGAMMDYQKAFADADARHAADREKQLMLKQATENAQLAAARAALDAKYAIRKQALASELDVAELNKALVGAEEGTRQREALVEAAKTAAARRDSLVAEAKRANDLLGGSKQVVNVTLDSSDPAQASTLKLINELSERVEAVEFNVTDKAMSAREYVDSRR